MSNDLVQRLRGVITQHFEFDYEVEAGLMNEAADRIEMLDLKISLLEQAMLLILDDANLSEETKRIARITLENKP